MPSSSTETKLHPSVDQFPRPPSARKFQKEQREVSSMAFRSSSFSDGVMSYVREKNWRIVNAITVLVSYIDSKGECEQMLDL